MIRVQFKRHHHHHRSDQSFRRCMLEDIQILQWCMNAQESPWKITLRGLFYCAVVNDLDRFKEE